MKNLLVVVTILGSVALAAACKTAQSSSSVKDDEDLSIQGSLGECLEYTGSNGVVYVRQPNGDFHGTNGVVYALQANGDFFSSEGVCSRQRNGNFHCSNGTVIRRLPNGNFQSSAGFVINCSRRSDG